MINIPQGLALDVPKRNVQARNGRHQYWTASIEAMTSKSLVDVFNVGWVPLAIEIMIMSILEIATGDAEDLRP